MPSMRDIKEKIASTKQMRKITKAMQMVSAAKLNHAQSAAQTYQPYADKLKEIVSSIAATLKNEGAEMHPMLKTRPVKKTAYFVITGDRGLAGAYNANVLKYTQQQIDQKHRSKDAYTVIVVGKVGLEYFKKRHHPIVLSRTGLPDELRFENVADLAKETVALYSNEEIDELHLIYNHFVNAVSQTLTDTRLLPLTDVEQEPTDTAATSYLYEPSESEVLDRLLPLYAEGLVYGALADAKAAELAARVTAMRNATDNANDIIEKLTLSFNRARQAAITQEISEIVGGAAALE